MILKSYFLCRMYVLLLILCIISLNVCTCNLARSFRWKCETIHTPDTQHNFSLLVHYDCICLWTNVRIDNTRSILHQLGESDKHLKESKPASPTSNDKLTTDYKGAHYYLSYTMIAIFACTCMDQFHKWKHNLASIISAKANSLLKQSNHSNFKW